MKLWVPVIKLKPVQIGSKNMQASKKTDEPHIKRQRKAVWLLAGGLGILLIAILVWRYFSSPNYGQVAVINNQTTPDTHLPEYTALSTNFYTLNYSQRYNQVPTDIAPPGVLDQKILAYQLGGQPGKSQIEINIKAAPYGGIVLDKTYDYYTKHPNQYQLSNNLYQGELVDIAKSKTGKPEAVGMWLHGSFLMTVKITTPDKDQDIDGELKDLLASVQWRES